MSQPFQCLGLIGDVHGEDEYLAIAIARLQGLGAEKLLCVGDLCDGRGDVNCVCDLLRENEVLTVRGNHDRWLLSGQARDLPEAISAETVEARTWEFLRALPLIIEMQTVVGTLLLCHGMGANDMGRLEPGDYGYGLENNLELLKIYLQADIAFVVAGHTHKLMVRRFARRSGAPLTIINAGQLKHNVGPVFAHADFSKGTVQFFEIHSEGVQAGPCFNWKEMAPEGASFR
ncbi:MAG TPA: metallophosphoesterase family protein [Abditibacteriaceae bacterium]|jgi:predicted phosphodiesterase